MKWLRFEERAVESGSRSWSSIIPSTKQRSHVSSEGGVARRAEEQLADSRAVYVDVAFRPMIGIVSLRPSSFDIPLRIGARRTPHSVYSPDLLNPRPSSTTIFDMLLAPRSPLREYTLIQDPRACNGIGRS